jgi:hypothetical protein
VVLHETLGQQLHLSSNKVPLQIPLEHFWSYSRQQAGAVNLFLVIFLLLISSVFFHLAWQQVFAKGYKMHLLHHPTSSLFVLWCSGHIMHLNAMCDMFLTNVTSVTPLNGSQCCTMWRLVTPKSVLLIGLTSQKFRKHCEVVRNLFSLVNSVLPVCEVAWTIRSGYVAWQISLHRS